MHSATELLMAKESPSSTRQGTWRDPQAVWVKQQKFPFPSQNLGTIFLLVATRRWQNCLTTTVN